MEAGSPVGSCGNNLPKAPQLLSGRPGIPNEVLWPFLLHWDVLLTCSSLPRGRSKICETTSLTTAWSLSSWPRLWNTSTFCLTQPTLFTTMAPPSMQWSPPMGSASWGLGDTSSTQKHTPSTLLPFTVAGGWRKSSGKWRAWWRNSTLSNRVDQDFRKQRWAQGHGNPQQGQEHPPHLKTWGRRSPPSRESHFSAALVSPLPRSWHYWDRFFWIPHNHWMIFLFCFWN